MSLAKCHGDIPSTASFQSYVMSGKVQVGLKKASVPPSFCCHCSDLCHCCIILLHSALIFSFLDTLFCNAAVGLCLLAPKDLTNNHPTHSLRCFCRYASMCTKSPNINQDWATGHPSIIHVETISMKFH